MRQRLDPPASRRLRIFAFDPSLALRLQTRAMNEIAVSVRWDKDRKAGRLLPGPIGEYIEVIDADPASGVVYSPVDLDDPILLAQDGLALSEGNPQFHQQMVYAVAMLTIAQFERALGRVTLWAPRRLSPSDKDNPSHAWVEQFVRRLRLYPHALRDRNAYYSPSKKAVLFGYFPTRGKDVYLTPGTTIFTCLSHDIIAHEVTHALLDGIHPRFNEPSNPDVRAFHEAFSDIVALFQKFSYPSVLRHQIDHARGALDSETMLSQLAQDFGRATGRGGALRDALGRQRNGKWERMPPDPTRLERAMEPHDRGSVLVAAVFGAFILLYRMRTRDLFRIATNGTGVLPAGDIHPDLTNRLAEEASRVAQTILQMCIRGIDYCPPVDVTFGDYLRAIVTADVTFNPDDDVARTAIIESFRAWGIYPRGIKSMSIESLVWPSGEAILSDMPEAEDDAADEIRGALRDLFDSPSGTSRQSSAAGGEANPYRLDGQAAHGNKWDLHEDRFEVWRAMQRNKAAVWHWVMLAAGRRYARAFQLVLEDADPDKPLRTIYRDKQNRPTVEVHSVRSALRRDTQGRNYTDLIIELTQRRAGFLDKDEQRKADSDPSAPFFTGEDRADFKFRAGCTVVIDTTSYAIRYVIATAGALDSENELDRVRAFLTQPADPSINAFDGVRSAGRNTSPAERAEEPFAMLHRRTME